jgi:hypothetical protein
MCFFRWRGLTLVTKDGRGARGAPRPATGRQQPICSLLCLYCSRMVVAGPGTRLFLRRSGMKACKADFPVLLISSVEELHNIH